MTVQAMNKKALEAALRYMGEFGWPTLLLALVVCGGYIATPLLVFQGELGLGGGVLVMAVCTYASYTVMHDAVHGAIAGRYTSVRWLNSTLGYLSGFVLGIPFTAHRHEHITHHRHTNDDQLDPDHQISRMTQSPWHAISCSWELVVGNLTYYRNSRWKIASSKEKALFLLELLVALGARFALMAQDFWLEGTVLFIFGPCIGLVSLIYLFAYIVHHPHQQTGRYVDTSTIEVAGIWGAAITWMWLFQNYHSIHHLFPKVPFYRYRALYRDIEPIMRAQGAPIYRLCWNGLELSEVTNNLTNPAR